MATMRSMGRITKTKIPDPVESLCAWLALAAVAAAAEAGADEVPARFRDLIDAGKVEFQFYQKGENPRPYLGYADYRFDVNPVFKYRYTWVMRGQLRHVTIRPVFRRASYRVAHTIHLPEYLDTDRRWKHPLVRHEFDHVAISLDPRLRLVVEQLYRQVRRIEVRVDGRTTVDNSLVKPILEERMKERTQAVIDLLAAYQALLDEATRHGTRRLSDRGAFFRSLYGKSSLEEVGFPYVDELAGWFESEAFRNAKLPYSAEF